MNSLKIYIGEMCLPHLTNKKVDVLVSATSKEHASELLEISLSSFNKYFKCSLELKHLEICKGELSKIFYSLKDKDSWQQYSFNINKPTCCSNCTNTKEFIFWKIAESGIDDKKYKIACWKCFKCGQLILQDFK